MNELQAKEEIQFIREMIEKTKMITAGSWNYFLVWGIVAILAVIGMYVLVFFEKHNWIWLNWVVFVGIGIVLTIFYGVKQERLQEMKTYAQDAMGHLGFACGMAFILVGFIFPLLGLYSYGVIPVLISTIAGIFAFVTGGIFEWNLLKWCGAIWWLGALGMLFIHWHYRALLFVPLIIIGYLVPAIVLRSMYRKERAKSAS